MNSYLARTRSTAPLSSHQVGTRSTASLIHSAASLISLIVLVLAFLAGCAVGPNYHRPPVDVPSEFRSPPTDSNAPMSTLPGTNTLAELPWWDVFKDPDLKQLIALSLTNNYDLQAAVARVEQASAVAAQNRSLFFPQLSYEATATRGRNASSSGTPFFTGGQTVDAFVLAGLGSWELDLWGRIRRLNQAARAQFLASEEARRDLTLSVMSEVAQSWFRLLALDAQLQIARRSTNSFSESLRIFSQRLEQGVVSKLETSAAEAALASAAATVPDLERQIAVQENLLNILVGRNPGSIPRTRTLLQEDISLTVPPGVPSDLLRRRPDIRQAEQLLRAANAQVGVAVADFFPHLSLTGLFGQVSPELSAFTAGGANAWNIGAQLAGPIFQGGRLRAQYRQALAAREESRVRFQAAFLNALQEVSNNLIALQKLSEARAQQARAVRAYEVAVQVSMERYIAGRASYYEVLQEQQLLFPAENSLVQIELNQFLAFIQLYRALGGGFGAQSGTATDS